MRVLIANRGEIARRVIRTAHAMGHETVAVYADPDRDSPHVREATTAVNIGPASLSESYLSTERILAAASESGSTAIHPGYGFLSENAGFASAVSDQGMIWIGPHPDAVVRMGSKIEARRLAADAGVPVIPGFDSSQDAGDLASAAAQIGFPVLLKASAGGGGKGIRIAHHPEDLDSALVEARSEAERSFGDGTMIVERFVERPRHIEVQLIGDKHGTVIHVETRECSVQRRYQKLLEEAPAPNLPSQTRQRLHEAAVALGRSIAYDSVGTVEFIVDDDDPESFFFLEMNTRLQVEHPVTELITGLDLVELQLLVAEGEPLPIAQDQVVVQGHAMEARINAEDATRDFAPQTGTISDLVVPAGARWDSGVETASEITPHYDPMIAKLIVHGADRELTRQLLCEALDDLLIGGLVTNSGFHRWLVDQPEFIAGHITTRFLDEAELPRAAEPTEVAAAAADAWWKATDHNREVGPWSSLGGRHFTPHTRARTVLLRDLAGDVHEIQQGDVDTASGEATISAVALDSRRVVVTVEGQSHTFCIATRSEHWSPDAGGGHGRANVISAPFPAVVTEVAVSGGSRVQQGDTIVVIEAMKMLHTLAATGPGIVAEVRVSPGDQVASGQVLVTFETPEEDEEE